MSLRLFGIDPVSGARQFGVDQYAAECVLTNRLTQEQPFTDMGGTVGVGPVTLESGGTPDSGISRVAAVVQGKQAVGDGQHYRPHPGMPSIGVLDYVQKLSTATLAAIGLLVLLVIVAHNPRGAFGWIAHSGVRRAGLE